MAHNEKPIVSVIIPNYNHEAFLEARIQSVLNQTFQDFELILLDDASTDGSEKILRAHASHPAVSHLEINSENSGRPFHQWEKGLSLAKGEFVWVAESDDLAAPEFLEKLLERARATGADLVYCRSRKIDSSGHPTGEHYWPDSLDSERWHHDFENSGMAEIRRSLCYRNTIPNANAVLFRNRPDFKLNDIRACRTTGDWLFWIRFLARNEKLAYLAQPLSDHRTHEGTTRSNARFENELARLKERLAAIHLARTIAGRGAIRPSEIRHYRYIFRQIEQLRRHPDRNDSLRTALPLSWRAWSRLLHWVDRIRGIQNKNEIERAK